MLVWMGIQQRGSVTGVVFADANGNGAQDAGEPGLVGVSVVVGSQTVVTDASGVYTASGVPAGSVAVDIVEASLPTGSVQTAGVDPTTVAVSVARLLMLVWMGIQQRGSVTGVVFADVNGNGAQDAGEPGLVGVSVVVGSQTVVTDASGIYTATGVPAGSVAVDIVEASLPTGSVQTAGVDPSTVTVTGGGTADAGADGFQQRGSVTGIVFADVNGNGAQDAGEPGLSGVSVTVGSQTVVTDASGVYTASGVPAGSISVDIVEASLPAGSVQTAGVDPSSVTVSGGATADAGVDGFQQRGSVTGVVFADANGNGTQDAGEPGLSGVSVTVGSQTVVTDASGIYTATGVPAGSVSVDIVEATLPTGSVQTAGVDPSTVIVTGGASVDAGSDGFQQRGGVTGVVFSDVNGNGARDVGEPGLSGVSVTVGSQTVVTDASGVYLASGVPAGSISVDIVEASLPTGSVQTAGVDPSTVTVTGGATADAGVDGLPAAWYRDRCRVLRCERERRP